MLSLKSLTVAAAGKTILKDISYTFEEGKIYVIMGPNGSGKSTLAHAIMGNPQYELSAASRIMMGSRRIDNITPDKRSAQGLFLSFQSPYALQGVTVFQMLRVALAGKRDPLELKKAIEQEAKLLHIKKDVLVRPLNESASGGEQKKMEVLQAAILNPKVAIFDEVDTGVDIDALKIISMYLNNIKAGKTFIFITHYSRILSQIKSDIVLVMKEGSIIREGDSKLLGEIERQGYDRL